MMGGEQNMSPIDQEPPQTAPNPTPPASKEKPLKVDEGFEPVQPPTEELPTQTQSPDTTTSTSHDDGFEPIQIKDEGFEPVTPSKRPPQFDSAPIAAHIESNLKEHFGILSASQAQPVEGPGILSASQARLQPEPQKADSWLTVIEAGLQMSTAGMGIRRDRPDLVVPPDADWFMRLLGNSATFAGDLPAIALGGAIGMAAGAETPVTAIGGAYAGANALPAAIRRAMMESFEKGSVKDFGDFWQRMGGVFLDTAKSAATGYATSLVGGITALETAVAQASAMTIMGKALDGHMPKPMDFLDSMLFVGAAHFLTHSQAIPEQATGKPIPVQSEFNHEGGAPKGEPVLPDVDGRLRNVFAETGMRPEEVALKAEANPALKTELLSDIPNHQKIMEMATGQPEGSFSHIDPATGKPNTGLTMYHDPGVSGQPGEGEFYVAEPVPGSADRKVIATLKYTPDGIKHLVVDPDYRNAGLAQHLLKTADEAGVDVSKSSNGFTKAGAGAVNRYLGNDTVKATLPDQSSDYIGKHTGRYGGDLGRHEEIGSITTEKKVGGTTVKEPSAAMKSVLSKLAEPEDKKAAPLINFDHAYEKVFDRTDPEKLAQEAMLDGKKLPDWQDPNKIMRMASDAPAKMYEFLTGGTMDYKTGARTGESAQAILQTIENKGLSQEILNGYMAAKRAGNLVKNGVENPGMPVEDSKTAVTEYSSEYDELAKRVTRYREAGTKYIADAGLLSKKMLPTWQAMDDAYIDYRRILPDEEGGGTTPNVSGGKPGSFKELKGVLDDAKTQYPLTAGLNSVNSLIKLAERNRARVSFYDLADEFNEKNPGNELVYKVSQNEKVTISPKQTQKWMDENNIPGDPKEFEAWVRQQRAILPANQDGVWRDGKFQIYEGPEDVMRAMKTLDGNIQTPGFIFRLMSGITNVAKTGFTATPDFAVKHLQRLGFLANAFPGVPRVGPLETLHAMGELMAESSNDWHRFLGSGGASLISEETVKGWMNNHIESLQKETGIMDAGYNMVNTPIRQAEEMARFFDAAVKFARFKKMTPAEGATREQEIGAGWAARNTGVDYQRMGALMAGNNLLFNNKTTSFLNLHLQSTDKMAQAFKPDVQWVMDKTGTTDYLKNIHDIDLFKKPLDPAELGFTRTAATAITLPTILLYWLNFGNKRMDDEDQSQKDMNFRQNIPAHLWGGEDFTYRQSIPPVLGLPFKVIPERIMDAFFKEHPHAWSGFNDTMLRMLAPTFIPDGFRGMSEEAVNKKFWSGGPVVSAGLERVLPKYQYTEGTSLVARAIGKLIPNIPVVGPTLAELGPENAKISSPQVIQNYIQNFGSVGDYAIKLIDEVAYRAGLAKDNRPAMTGFDTPFAKSFMVRFPTMSASPIHNFKSRFGDGSQIMNSITMLEKQGNADEAAQLLSENQDRLINLSKINTTIEGVGQQISGINRLPVKDEKGQVVYSKDDKRTQIDGLMYSAIEAAKIGMQIFDQIDEAAAKTQEASQHKNTPLDQRRHILFNK